MCCGRFFEDCCWGLFTFLAGAGFSILIYWAIFQPHHIRATVDSATLANLTVDVSNATVSYRLSVGLILYNPSLRVNVYYDALDAGLRFRGVSLGGPAASTTSPTEFYQRRKSGDNVKVEFDGSAGVGVPGDVAGELEKEIVRGAVSLEVAMDALVRYRFDRIKIRQKPKIRCWLTIPVKPEGRSVAGALASGDRCSVKY